MEKINPDKRAKELHNKISDEFKKRMITIAVGNTESEISLVGTSERYMQSEVLYSMTENEIIATPREGTHAEEDIINEANERNLKVTEIGASRPICLECQEQLSANQIESKTDFSNKYSKKRRK